MKFILLICFFIFFGCEAATFAKIEINEIEEFCSDKNGLVLLRSFVTGEKRFICGNGKDYDISIIKKDKK